MNDSNNKSRQSISGDLFEVLLVSQAPRLAKMLVDSIPDLTYERYIKDHKSIWNVAFPATSLAILRKYEGSELGKTFMVQMSAAINRAINDRAGNINLSLGEGQSNKTAIYPLSFAMLSLDKDSILSLTKLISTLSEHQKRAMMAIELGNQESAEKVLNTLISFDQEQFKAWADLMVPDEKPREKTEIEKKLSSDFDEFIGDAESYFKKETWLDRMARKARETKEKRGLM